MARWIPEFIINCSHRSATIHAELGYAQADVMVIPNGYDGSIFHIDDRERSVTRRQLGVAPDCFLVGTIGRWHTQKDIPTFLKAIAIASARNVPICALLIGRGLGKDDAHVATAARAAGCESDILALGPRQDVPRLARAMDLHLLASSGGEAFPNVVGETMLSGTPNIVTDVGDAGLIVGETGWVVPPRNPHELADAIETAWREYRANPSAWKQRRVDGRKRIAENFSFEKMAMAYEDVWQRIASPRYKPNSPESSARASDFQ